MNKNIITIIKKEFARFFGDKVLMFSTMLLPGLMIYVLYSFMGKAMVSQFATAENYVYDVCIVNPPLSVPEIWLSGTFDLTEVDMTDVEEVKMQVQEQTSDLLVVFPENFDEQVFAYDCMTAENPAPQVEIYYNSASTESENAYGIVMQMLDTYENALANKFDVNAAEDIDYDMATDKDMTARVFSMMLPMLLMMFLFSGCVSIATESIAGEKERGTMATLLVTPMKRSHLALGKIISLSVIGLLSGVSSFLGTMLSLPNLMGGAADSGESVLSASVYGAKEYLLLLCVILSTVLVIVGVLSLISTLAKSVKAAGSAMSPLMILVMVLSVTTMMRDSIPREPYWYLIPFYNSVQCMNGIFSFAVQPYQFVITVASNLVYTAALVCILARMFDSEKMMNHV